MRLNLKNSSIVGLSFGLTSAVITTLGLMVGLSAGTHSRLVVLGGILTIAVADAFSDALGIHISQEAQNNVSTKEVWEATFMTFVAKLLFALTFVFAVLILPIDIAVIVNVVWGLFLLFLLSFLIAYSKKEPAQYVIAEHVGVAVVVIAITNLIGKLLNQYFQ